MLLIHKFTYKKIHGFDISVSIHWEVRIDTSQHVVPSAIRLHGVHSFEKSFRFRANSLASTLYTVPYAPCTEYLHDIYQHLPEQKN